MLLLHEVALGLVEEARNAIASGDHDRMRDRIGRAIAAFDELVSTFETDPAVDGAGGLLLMYRSCQECLVEVAARRDPEAAQDLVSTLASMREAWAVLAAA
jgi:flagellin-specific chaperone FliS